MGRPKLVKPKCIHCEKKVAIIPRKKPMFCSLRCGYGYALLGMGYIPVDDVLAERQVLDASANPSPIGEEEEESEHEDPRKMGWVGRDGLP